MRLVATLVGAVAVAVIVIGGITMYLGPNDLAKCGIHPSAVSGCGAADAIVAVSGGDTLARAQGAIQLYKDGWAPELIFSGAAEDKSGPSNAAVMKQEALNEGVPSSVVIIEQSSATTKQNAEATSNIFTTHHINSVILVTSAYHQRRASLEFHQFAPHVSLRNRPISHDSQWSMWWWATPIGWFLAISELVKIAVFYIGGSQ